MNVNLLSYKAIASPIKPELMFRENGLGLDGFTLPYDKHFSVLEIFENGRVREHLQVNKNAFDYALVKSIAFEKARIENDVDIMPELNPFNKHRSIIYYDAKGFKNPDLRINGILYEIEQPQIPIGIKNIQGRIRAGVAQADHVIIDLLSPVDENIFERACNSKFPLYETLQTIEFRFEGRYKAFSRVEWEQKKAPRKSRGVGQPVG